MAKAQLHTMPVYILGSIIVILIFAFGYTAISDISERDKTLTSWSVTTKLKEDVKSISSEYGSVKRVSYDVTNDISEVCFLGNKDECNLPPILTCNQNQISSNVAKNFIDIQDGNKNMLLIGKSSLIKSDYISGLSIGCCEYICTKNTNNKINLIIEGKGGKALIKTT